MTKCFQILLIGSVISAAFFSACRKAYESVPLGQQIPTEIAFDPHDSAGTYAMRFLLTTYN
jgi:starch-binding outer membrane protein, SusD/RagB family